MAIILGVLFVITLTLSIYQLRKIRRLSSRINTLESVILGERTGKSIPYESLHLLNILRLQARQWTSSEENPALLTIRPVCIELLDDYMSKLLASIPELNLMIEPRPSYASLYSINSVMFYIDSEKHEKLPIRFHCANQDLAERIANLLLSKGIEARAAIEMSHVD